MRLLFSLNQFQNSLAIGDLSFFLESDSLSHVQEEDEMRKNAAIKCADIRTLLENFDFIMWRLYLFLCTSAEFEVSFVGI